MQFYLFAAAAAAFFVATLEMINNSYDIVTPQ